MILQFDHFDRASPPLLYLHNPGGKRIAPIPERSYTGLKIKIVFNGVSEISLDAYKYLPGIDNVKIESDAYPYIQGQRQIYVNDLGYFIIQSVEETDDGENPFKTIDAVSCEIEIDNKGLVLQEGVYQFYSNTNPENTIMGMVIEKLPNWSIGKVPDTLLTRHRHFDDLTTQLYNFLTNEVQELYSCIFDFDIKNRIINVIDADEGIQSTDIYLSHENLVHELQVQTRIDDCATALEVLGGDDLDISAVNPTGGNIIYDFSYVKSTDWMDQNLINKINAWETRISSEQERFKNVFSAYRQKNNELLSLKSSLIKPETDLKSAETIYTTLKSTNADTSRIDAKWQEIRTLQDKVDGIKASINVKQAEVAECVSQLNEITSSLSFDNNFTQTELAELSPFIRQKQYTDENIIVTESMSDNERLDCMQELYDKGKKKLREIIEPPETFDIDCDNFLFIKEFDRFREQLETGKLIHARMNYGYIVHLALMAYEVSFDDSNLTLTLGNKYKQNDPYSLYADIYKNVSKSASTVASKRKLWDKPFQNNKFQQYDAALNQSIDLSAKAIINSGNQSITQDHRGIILRAPKDPEHPELGYNDGQIWMTNNGILLTQKPFENIADHQISSSVAIGNIVLPAGSPYIDENGNKQTYDDAKTVYGVNAELLYGELTLSQNLIVTGLISGNVIETNTLNASSIVAGSITSREIDAGAITADKISANAITGDKINARNLTVTNNSGVNTLSIDENGDVSLNVKSLSITGNQVATQGDLTSGINGLQIGSRNYIKDSVSRTLTANSTSDWYYNNLYTGLENTQYTFSVGKISVISGSATKVSVLIYDINNAKLIQTMYLNVSNSKQQISFTPPPSSAALSLLIYAGVAGSTAGNSLKYEHMKLEKGSKATDWTPAPEDRSYLVNTLSPTQADGMWLGSDGRLYINATNITAGYLNASRIKSGTLLLGGSNGVNGNLKVEGNYADMYAESYNLNDTLYTSSLSFRNKSGTELFYVRPVKLGTLEQVQIGGRRAFYIRSLSENGSTAAELYLGGPKSMGTTGAIASINAPDGIELDGYIMASDSVRLENSKTIYGRTTGDVAQPMIGKSTSNHTIVGNGNQSGNTEIYSKSGGSISLCLGGTEKFRVDDSGAALYGSNTNIRSINGAPIKFYISGQLCGYIDKSGWHNP